MIKGDDMRSKNGFTLVEVLAVMIILGLLMILIIPAYTSIFTGIKRNSYQNKIVELTNAAKKYGNKVKDEVKEYMDDPNKKGCYIVEPSLLIEKGYIQSDLDNKPALIDPADNLEMTGVVRICYCKSKFDIEAYYVEEFNAATSYYEGDVVSDPKDGTLYECVINYTARRADSSNNITGEGLNRKTDGKSNFIKIEC